MTTPEQPGCPRRPDYVVPGGAGIWRLMVWAQPGASANEVAGEYRGRLKVKLAAPAVDNKANKALVAFVARLLGARKSAVRLEKGAASRDKTLVIEMDGEPAWTRVIP